MKLNEGEEEKGRKEGQGTERGREGGKEVVLRPAISGRESAAVAGWNVWEGGALRHGGHREDGGF